VRAGEDGTRRKEVAFPLVRPLKPVVRFNTGNVALLSQAMDDLLGFIRIPIGSY
jgi:hypothetical protein